jgi:hypothetical protein
MASRAGLGPLQQAVPCQGFEGVSIRWVLPCITALIF